VSGRGVPTVPLLGFAGAALWLFWLNAAHGAEQRIACPLAFDVAERKGPPGWRLVTQADARPDGKPAKLISAGLLHGDPTEPGYLIPDTSKGRKQGNRAMWVQTWKLPHWYETYAYCGYGKDASWTLFYTITDDADDCTLTSSRTNGSLVSVQFVCK
jgi:hypothetical protein